VILTLSIKEAEVLAEIIEKTELKGKKANVADDVYAALMDVVDEWGEDEEEGESEDDELDDDEDDEEE